MEKIKKYKDYIITVIILVIAELITFFINGTGIPCIFSKLTGLSCPGCGISRMFISLIKLDIYQAFRYNPLVFILLCIYLIYLPLKLMIKKDLKIPNWFYILLLIIVITYGILRNISGFAYLLPTEVN